MVGRGLWFAAGAAAGVYGMVRAKRIVEAFTVDGMRDRVGAAVLGARMFSEELAQGAVEAETDLREKYEIAANGHRQLGDSSGLDTPALVPHAGGSTTKGLGGRAGASASERRVETSDGSTSNDNSQEDQT